MYPLGLGEESKPLFLLGAESWEQFGISQLDPGVPQVKSDG